MLPLRNLHDWLVPSGLEAREFSCRLVFSRRVIQIRAVTITEAMPAIDVWRSKLMTAKPTSTRVETERPHEALMLPVPDLHDWSAPFDCIARVAEMQALLQPAG